MSSSKEYYWRKMLPKNPVTLEDGREILFEDMGSPGDIGYRLGYVVVGEDVHKELKKVSGSGLREGTKSEYDEIKKKLLDDPLQPQWREEISADNRPRQTRQLSAVVDKTAARDAIEVQSKVDPLPEGAKPKTGKRIAADQEEE
tara:strand:- start:75 stop:506 length:432 start_codon:yes stop_codon:yes gene_type:complete